VQTWDEIARVQQLNS